MDIPLEPLPQCLYDWMRLLLYAIEKSSRRLEEVSITIPDVVLSNNCRKVAAVDFFGAFLALGGSAVVVVHKLRLFK